VYDNPPADALAEGGKKMAHLTPYKEALPGDITWCVCPGFNFFFLLI
jgi:hypothetical protein